MLDYLQEAWTLFFSVVYFVRLTHGESDIVQPRGKKMTHGTRPMTVTQIAAAVKAAFLAWLKERTEHLYKILQMEDTLSLAIANSRNRQLTDVQKDDMQKFIEQMKEKFNLTPVLYKDTDLIVIWKLRLQ